MSEQCGREWERWSAVRRAVATEHGPGDSCPFPTDEAAGPRQRPIRVGGSAGHFDPLFEALLRQTGEAVFLLDGAGRVIEANRAARQAFGDRLAEPGNAWTRLWPAAARGLAGDAVRRARSGATVRLSIHRPAAGGAGQWWDVLVGPVRAEGRSGARMLATCRDSTAQHNSADDLLRAAEHDPLTLLPNRRAFQRRLEASILRGMERGSPVGLVLLDLDHFSQVNEALGIAAGDHLLRTVSVRLKDLLKPTDCLARVGGDAFAIIVEGLKGIDELSRESECMLERVRLPTCHAGRLINVGASIGGSVYPRDGGSAHDLLKSAECALQAVKAEGRGASRMFHHHMRVDAQRKASQRNLARVALLERSIVPVYQPKMDLRSGEIVGVEALLRWSHPRRGLQGPETLAEAFKEYELASSLGRMMQQAAIADLQRWRKAGIDCRHISINAAPAEFMRDDFAERLLEALDIGCIPPQLIQLEITEQALFDEGSGHVARAVEALSDRGIRICLDDFGTGYSSLAHLRDLPVDVLKIDRSFVACLEQSEESAAIVQALIDLAAKLGLDLVAEGIETLAQLRTLRERGCAMGQGYLISKPIPGGDLCRFLNQASRLELSR